MLPLSKRKPLPEEPAEFKNVMEGLMEAAQRRVPAAANAHEPPSPARSSLLAPNTSKLDKLINSPLKASRRNNRLQNQSMMNLCQPLKIEEVKEIEENDDNGLPKDQRLKGGLLSSRYSSRLSQHLGNPIDQVAAKNSGVKLFNEAEWDEIQLGHDGPPRDLNQSGLDRPSQAKPKMLKNNSIIK